MDHESALIRAFVLQPKRDRLLKSLNNPKLRRKALDALYHFRDLDPRFIVQVPTGDHRPTTIAALLRERGASDQCHLISTAADLDGRDMELTEALERIIGFGDGTLLSCIPGELGYFEGEGPKHRCLLVRAAV